ncbi:M16 family metallopeptidase [Kordiimonas marina]|uniref:M16 family metallopeptidase n=1 Tax=Kordiimonas marina TaxID=2872312 RepID=UPI001FF18CB2|nr:pitrilysin family protein [Kordiimonas marina]MCJ9427636.1 insulinase family protein [Kordiimonas marina]
MSVRLTRLDNGLRIVSESRPLLQTVAVGVWVDVGARHETPAQNGITHCIEHMLFKGTERRSARDIAFEIEAVGGHMNAGTARDQTSYYARVMKEDMGLALDLLADIILNSRFDAGELTREKEVIIQEIGQAIDTPDDIIFDHLQAVSFGGQPLGRSILGEPETVRSFTPDDLRGFLQSKYTASNIVISAVGNLDHGALVAQVMEKFSALPEGPRHETVPATFTGGRHLDKRELEQIHVALGWRGASFHEDDYYALQVYSTILGGGMSSRLFQEVRENRGLAYSVYSFTSSHKETGIFGLYAGTGPDMAADMMPVIRAEMEALTKGPTDQEFGIALAQLKAGLTMALEATTSRMEQLGRQMLVFDRIIPVEEMLANVSRVTPADVKAMATRILDENAVSTALVGGGALEKVNF